MARVKKPGSGKVLATQPVSQEWKSAALESNQINRVELTPRAKSSTEEVLYTRAGEQVDVCYSAP